jgi:hypothetical protein
MRSFLIALALGAGIVGWSASAVRAADDEKPATTPSTEPAEKSEGTSGASDASADAKKADKSADDAKQAGSSEKPAAETPAK